MRCSVLQILDLHSYHCAGERSVVPGLLQLRGQQLWWQRWVEGVCQQDKLKLHLDGNTKITLALRSQISASQRGQRPNPRQYMKPVQLSSLWIDSGGFLMSGVFFPLKMASNILQLRIRILPSSPQLAEVWKTIDPADSAAPTSLDKMNDHMKLKAKRKRQGPGEMYTCLWYWQEQHKGNEEEEHLSTRFARHDHSEVWVRDSWFPKPF